MELSLIYKILRRKIRGKLGKDVYHALGVYHKDKDWRKLNARGTYLEADESFLNCSDLKSRSQILKILQKRRRTICKVSGCNSLSHNLFGKDGI